MWHLLSPLVFAVPFITTWDIVSGRELSLWFSAPVSVNVSWGDGATTENVMVSKQYSHLYSSTSTLNISVSGNVTGFVCSDCVGLTSIEQWGDFMIGTDQSGIFAGVTNLLSVVARDVPKIVNNATLERMFAGCTMLNSDIVLNTRGVRSVRGMFQQAEIFNGNVILSDTSSVTDFSNMFESAWKFNRPVYFNTSSATNMYRMFYDTLKGDYFQDFSMWDVRNVTTCLYFCKFCSLPVFPNCATCGTTLVKTSPTKKRVCYCSGNEVERNSSACGREFISTWSVQAQAYSFPFQGVEFDVVWGDGSNDLQVKNPDNTGVVTKTYQSAGVVTIRIRGEFTLRSLYVSDLASMLLGVQQWGGLTFSNTISENMFHNCINLVVTATDQPLITPGASLKGIFRGCFLLNSSFFWDLTGVISLEEAFSECSSMTTNNTISLITPNVTNMRNMFANTNQFNSPVILDTRQVITMEGMFRGAKAFNQNLSSFDTRNVQFMGLMFADTVAFQQDLKFMNTSSVTSMGAMFYRSSYTQPLSLDISNVVSMANMFQESSRTNQPLIFKNPNSLLNTAYMFADSLFNYNVQLNAPNLLTVASMFKNASFFNSSVTLTKTNLKDTTEMFSGATSFNSPLHLDTQSVERMSGMFMNAYAFNQALNFTTSTVISMKQMFENATSFNSLILFDVSAVTDMSQMFTGASRFNQVIVRSFNTSQVISMYRMFDLVDSFTIDLEKWDVSKVENCLSFCQDCGKPNFRCQTCLNPQLMSSKNVSVCECGYNEYLPIRTTTQCVPVPCYSPRFVGLPGECKCARGYTGQVMYGELGFLSGCEMIECPLVGYKIDNGICQCDIGYEGNVHYVGTNVSGCAPIPCPAPAYVRNTNGMCECAPGAKGFAVYNATEVNGCELELPCPPPFYEMQGRECVCSPPATGTPLYNGNTITGCVPPDPQINITNVTVPFSANANTTQVNASGVVVVIQPDPLWGDNGSLSIVIKPVAASTVSQVISINFFEGDQKKNISGLTNPIKFFIPLLPGAATPIQACMKQMPVVVVPACHWFDPVDFTWKTSGCNTSLSTTQVECTCTHLTDFAAVFPRTNPIPLNQILYLSDTNIAAYPDGVLTVGVVLAVFAIVMLAALYRDKREKKREAELKSEKFAKWQKATESQAQITYRTHWCKQFKNGLQLRHTWGSLFFRKSGTTFRSVDRVIVCLFMVLVHMSMSANFHDRNKTLVNKAEITVINILVSLPPGLLLTHLFTHTGEMGFYEKWRLNKGITKTLKHRCLRYRFSERWRVVWYGMVLVSVMGMIVYILSIALMFDQNPEYYCRGKTTESWIVDFIIPYAISVCVVEPVKIALLLTSRGVWRDLRTKARLQKESTVNVSLESSSGTEIQTMPQAAVRI